MAKSPLENEIRPDLHTADYKYTFSGNFDDRIGQDREPMALSYQLINATNAVKGIEANLKTAYESDRKIRKAKELDAKSCIEDLVKLVKEGDDKLSACNNQVGQLKRANDILRRQAESLQFEKQKVINQLQNLFTLYTKNKRDMDSRTRSQSTFEIENKSNKDRISFLEAEVARLREANQRQSDQLREQSNKQVKEIERLEKKLVEKERRISDYEEEKYKWRSYEKDIKDEQLQIITILLS